MLITKPLVASQQTYLPLVVIHKYTDDVWFR